MKTRRQKLIFVLMKNNEKDDHKQAEKVLNVLYKAGLRLGVNWRRELRELINDIAMRDGLSCEQVINCHDIKAVLKNPKLTSPQKLERIKDILMTRRYPRLSKAELEFKKQIKNLNISNNIKINHTPYFEEEDIYVEFRFTNQDELGQAIESLKKLQGVELVKNALETSKDSC